MHNLINQECKICDTEKWSSLKYISWSSLYFDRFKSGWELDIILKMLREAYSGFFSQEGLKFLYHLRGGGRPTPPKHIFHWSMRGMSPHSHPWIYLWIITSGLSQWGRSNRPRIRPAYSKKSERAMGVVIVIPRTGLCQENWPLMLN